MSAKHYIENVGMVVETELFSNGHNKYLLMQVDLQRDTPQPYYSVFKDSQVVIATPHLKLALETYDSL